MSESQERDVEAQAVVGPPLLPALHEGQKVYSVRTQNI